VPDFCQKFNVFWSWGSFVFNILRFLFHSVNQFNYHENGKCYDQKINDRMNKHTISNGHHFLKNISLGIQNFGTEHPHEVFKINSTNNIAKNWHNYIFNQRVNYGVESNTNDNSNCHFEHIALN